MKKTRILLADDHSFLRMGLRTLLAAQKDLAVVGEAANGQEAVDLVRGLKPDVVIMDLLMPKVNGAEATRLVRTASPETKVLVLTSFGTSDELRQAIANGASGALMKDAASDDLLAAIRTIAAGGTVRTDGLGEPVTAPLGENYLNILSLVAQGFSNPDIARNLGLSEITIKKHLSAIYRKLGVANRAEAVALALREGLIRR